ncbi:hypothetical protein ABZP36_017445 [Zizania latifolia]
MADEPAAASHSSSSSPVEEDDEGTESEDSKSDHGAGRQELPAPTSDASVPPPAPAASEQTGADAIPQALPAGAGTEDSRRLFQRLWTDEEELLILRGFLDFTTRRGTTFASHQYDTGSFYEEIRRQLSFDFSKNQLIEKLRRLKKKYRVCASRMTAQGGAFAFKSAHEGGIYDLARHIWPPALKRDGAGGGDVSDEDDINPAAAVAGTATMPVPQIAQPPPVSEPAQAPVVANDATEEAVRSIMLPILKEFISSVAVPGQNGSGLGLGMGFGCVGCADIVGLCFGITGLNPGVPSVDKWRQQQILELEVYLKRIQLVREQVMAALEELRSSEG